MEEDDVKHDLSCPGFHQSNILFIGHVSSMFNYILCVDLTSDKLMAGSARRATGDLVSGKKKVHQQNRSPSTDTSGGLKRNLNRFHFICDDSSNCLYDFAQHSTDEYSEYFPLNNHHWIDVS